MRKAAALFLFAVGFATPTITSAQVDDTVIYGTLAECKAALAQARMQDPYYYTRECRQEGEGWSFRIRDRPDGSTAPGK